MRKPNLIWIALVLFTIGFVSCEKSGDDLQPDTLEMISAEDAAAFETVVEDSEDILAIQMDLSDGYLTAEANGSDCPEVNWSQPQGTFPNTLTIDFGDACPGPKGNIRSGKIIIELTAPLLEAGSVKTTSFDNFHLNDVLVTGNIIATNNGVDDAGKPSRTRQVGLQLLFPNGKNASWDASHTISMIGGKDTPMKLDNIFTIEGIAIGINRNGVTFESEIIKALIKDRNCPWIVAGIQLISFNDKERMIDYGNGICDRFAFVTLDNGDTHRIILKRERK